MTSPLRKENREELTTADIAGGQRQPTTEPIDEARGKPVQSQRDPVDITAGKPAQQVPSTSSHAVSTAPLFPETELTELRKRWDGIQTGFVDQPRKAVEEADNLVA